MVSILSKDVELLRVMSISFEGRLWSQNFWDDPSPAVDSVKLGMFV